MVHSTQHVWLHDHDDVKIGVRGLKIGSANGAILGEIRATLGEIQDRHTVLVVCDGTSYGITISTAQLRTLHAACLARLVEVDAGERVA